MFPAVKASLHLGTKVKTVLFGKLILICYCWVSQGLLKGKFCFLIFGSSHSLWHIYKNNSIIQFVVVTQSVSLSHNPCACHTTLVLVTLCTKSYMCVTQSFGLLNNHFPYAYLSGDKKCILTLSQLLFKLSLGFIFKVKQETIYLLISGIDRGDVVSVYCDLENKCRKGLIKPFDGQKVFVGNGIAALARKEIFCSKQNIRCVNMTLASWGRGCLTQDLPYTPKLQPLPLYFTVFDRKCSFVSFSYTFL